MKLRKNKWYTLHEEESVIYLGADWASNAVGRWRVYRFYTKYGEMRLSAADVIKDIRPGNPTKLQRLLNNV